MRPFSWLFSGMIGDIQVSDSTAEANRDSDRLKQGKSHQPRSASGRWQNGL